MQSIINKSVNILKFIYRINKLQLLNINLSPNKLMEFLKTIFKKEELTKNVLNQEDLKKFAQLKFIFIESLILTFN